MRRSIRVCFVYSVPVADIRSDFLTNIPIRMRRLLGSDVEVSVLYNGSLNEKRLVENGIEVSRVRLSPLAKRLSALRLLAMAVETNRLAKDKGIDIFINANNHNYFFAAALGAKLARKAALSRVTGILPKQPNSNGLRRIRKALGRIIARISLAFADKGICLSTHLKTKLINTGVASDKLIVLSQGVDLTRFEIRKRNRKEKTKTLLYVGRLEPMKGVEDAIRAFNIAKESHSELTFTICGDGSLRQRLAREYGGVDEITFLGHVSYDELPVIYQSADILLLPSYSEGLPNVVLEAMASGVAVIASNVGDNNILLDYGRRGILVEPGKIGQICSAIFQYIDNPSFFYACVRDGRRYVEKGHSFDILRRRYLRLFEAVIEE